MICFTTGRVLRQPWSNFCANFASTLVLTLATSALILVQARQLLIHGHIAIGEQVMTVPGYILTREEEVGLQYDSKSPLSDPEHAMRQEIDLIRASADYSSEDEVALDSDSEAPTPEEVTKLEEAVASAPSSDDSTGGEA